MNAKRENPFFDVPIAMRETSLGEVGLPILYYDTTAAFALFWCERGRVDAVLEGTQLTPAVTFLGRALVAIACFEYRDTSIGPYNEVGLAIPVRPQGVRSWIPGPLDLLRQVDKRTVGFYVKELPVTTDAACQAGRTFWGYPKFVTEIGFGLQRRSLTCTVSDPEGESSIMSLTGDMGRSIRIPPFSFFNYDRLDGQPLRTTIYVRGATYLHLPGKVRLTLGDSDHFMKETLLNLGMSDKRPFAMMLSRESQSRLHAGIPL